MFGPNQQAKEHRTEPLQDKQQEKYSMSADEEPARLRSLKKFQKQVTKYLKKEGLVENGEYTLPKIPDNATVVPRRHFQQQTEEPSRLRNLGEFREEISEQLGQRKIEEFEESVEIPAMPEVKPDVVRRNVMPTNVTLVGISEEDLSRLGLSFIEVDTHHPVQTSSLVYKDPVSTVYISDGEKMLSGAFHHPIYLEEDSITIAPNNGGALICVNRGGNSSDNESGNREAVGRTEIYKVSSQGKLSGPFLTIETSEYVKLLREANERQ